MTHNPALINTLQFILIIIIALILNVTPAIVFMSQGPNGFILATLPGLTSTLVIIPLLFYGFNKKLRKYVVRQWRELLGLEQNAVYDINV